MTPEEYVELDATAIAAAVNAGTLSFAEVHAAATEMHRRTDDAIHAVVEWYDEPSAGAATGALAGVPFLRKDYGSTEAGRLQEMGSRLTSGVRPTTTSPYYRRLAAAGARVVGRSAVPEFVMHGTTESLAFGVTRNPHDPGLSVGGSSGGSAAAVAAGVVPAAHATDCAGSIRIPAAACGLVGLKPTSRVVPLDQGDWGGIAVEFVVSRTARDQRTFFEVLADGTPNPERGRLRIGVTTEHWGGEALGPGMVAGIERVARVLDDAGYEIVPIPPPVDIADVMRGWDAHFGRWVALDVERWAEATGRPIDDTTLEPVTLMQLEQVRATSVERLTADQLAADHALAMMESRLESIDIVLSATNDRAALPLDDLSGLLPDMDTYLAANDSYFSSLFPANITGRPAVSVPMGQVTGAPAGAQLLGRRGDDLLLIGLAALLEDAGIGRDELG
ncbi:MAG: amidase [Actinomycetota bacterium]